MGEGPPETGALFSSGRLSSTAAACGDTQFVRPKKGLPVILAVAMPGRWQRWSSGIRTWTVAEGSVVLGLLVVGIGVLVSAQGLLGLLP